MIDTTRLTNPRRVPALYRNHKTVYLKDFSIDRLEVFSVHNIFSFIIFQPLSSASFH